MSPVILETNLPGVSLINRGKVRDIYEVDASTLLIVATDRISAFDCVLPDGVPGKGRVLTALSVFWFNFFKGNFQTHFVTNNLNEYPARLRSFEAQLEGRSMLVKKASMFKAECVVRGYAAGSGWKDYVRTGKICGIPLPAGMTENQRLPNPIFTPSTKADAGHDENIDFVAFKQIVGRASTAAALQEMSLKAYTLAAQYAHDRGIIIADTKFEFGMVDGQIVLADEVLTPDSSRFWPLETYAAGRQQPSYDKQYLRDYLVGAGWNKEPPAPGVPVSIIQQTAQKYREALRTLTGAHLE